MRWIIGGKQYNEEEYAEYKKQEDKRWELAQIETWRLIRTVAEACTACEKFIENNPQYPYGLKDDAEQREFKIYEKLRSNLGAANRAPRCERVREDGTRCGCPQMKGHSYCYAHERMVETRSEKMKMATLEDGNGIQMAIMRVQKALIDDEISEKKARLLLYSLNLAARNLKNTTFTENKKDVVTEMPKSITQPGQGHLTTEGTEEHRGRSNALTTHSLRSGQAADTKEHEGLPKLSDIAGIENRESLPQIDADERGSEEIGKTANQENLLLDGSGRKKAGRKHPQLRAAPPQQAKCGPAGIPVLCHTSIGTGETYAKLG